MNDESIDAWQQANELFELYIDKPVPIAIEEVENLTTISTAAKDILIKLIKAQPQDATQIDKVDLSLFAVIEESMSDLSGKNIEDYYLLEKIGSGGMSAVYKAKRLNRDIQKFVALKVLRSQKESDNKTLKYLFQQEQQTLAKLNHKNIISFHHGGVSKEGITYLVMDYLQSPQSISQYCLKHKLNARQIIELIMPIADAVYYAHQQLIIHKDIKPNNILLDTQGIPHLLDFGISSITDSIKDKNHLNIYTPDYASPEQLLNQSVTITSDVFSFCATLLSLLTGEKTGLKVVKNNQVSSNIKEVLIQSTLDSDLKNILDKGLSLSTAGRYQSMLELKTDLLNWLQLKPVMATKHSNFYVLRKFIIRNPLSSVLVSSLFFAVILSLFFMFKQMHNAQQEAEKAQQVTNFLIESIQASDPDVTKGKDVSVKEFLTNAKLKIQETTILEPKLLSTLEKTIGSALVKVGEYKEAETLLLSAIKTNANNYDARLALIQLYNEQKEYRKLDKQFSFLRTKEDNLSDMQKILLHQLHATQLYQQGHFSQAIEEIKSTLNKKMDAKLTISSQLIYAKILDEKGESAESTKILEQALALSQKNFTEFSTTTLLVYQRLVNVLTNYDDIPYERVFKLYDKIIKNEETIYGSNHPQLAKAYLQYGFLLKVTNKIGKSKAFAQKAREIAVNNFGESHILTAHVDLLLSQLLLIENKKLEATEKLENIVKVYSKTYGDSHFETNQVKTTLAFYYLINEQAQKSLSLLLPLYELQKQQLGEANKATLYVVVNILKAYYQTKEYNKAIALGEKVLPLSQDNLGKDFAITVGLQVYLAQNYLALERNDDAYDLLKPLLKTNYIKNNSSYLQKISALLKQAHNSQ